MSTHPLVAIGFLLILAMVAFACVEIWNTAIAPLIAPGDLGDIEWTEHARNIGEERAAYDIVPTIARQGCAPIEVWVCQTEVSKFICPAEPGSEIWIGAIVSLTTNRVITFYPADYPYWSRSMVRDGCTLTMVIP